MEEKTDLGFYKCTSNSLFCDNDDHCNDLFN